MMIEFRKEILPVDECKRILAEHDEAVSAGEIINRPRKMNTARRYAFDLRTDQWYSETGESIKFQTSESILRGKNLVDGQNRLAAAILADKPLAVYVARGVERRAFSYIDGGDKRSLADALHISGESEAKILAPALKLLCLWDENAGRFSGNSSVSTQTARKLLESDPFIRKSVTKAKEVKESGLLTVAAAAFLHRIFSAINRQVADKFIDAIATGTRLEATDPFLILRQRLIENKGSRRKINLRDQMKLCIKAFNFKQQERSIKILPLKKGEEVVLESAMAADNARNQKVGKEESYNVQTAV
jgi:hypothetical protein